MVSAHTGKKPVRHRIAAVCAPQPNNNPGMQSVDMALVAFARHHPELDIRLYRMPVADRNEPEGTLGYGNLIADWEEIRHSDRILYWGDFHQMLSYIREIDRRRSDRGIAREIEAEGPTSRYLLLDGSGPDLRRRAVGFGGTLLHNSSHDYATPSYREPLRLLLAEGRAWWFRDPYSATDAAALAGNYERSFLGTDASLLLAAGDPSPSGTDTSPASTRAHLGLYLGRGYRSHGERYRFATKLAALLDLSVTWIPWMPDRGTGRSRKFRLRHPLFARQVSMGRRSLASLLADIADCSVIVTDTYHLAINAWRIGVPAICIGHDVSPQPVDVSSGPRFEWRDKRHVFYSMYGLHGFYVHQYELEVGNLRRARLRQLQARLADPKFDLDSFQSRIESEREQFGRMLFEALTT